MHAEAESGERQRAAECILTRCAGGLGGEQGGALYAHGGLHYEADLHTGREAATPLFPWTRSGRKRIAGACEEGRRSSRRGPAKLRAHVLGPAQRGESIATTPSSIGLAAGLSRGQEGSLSIRHARGRGVGVLV